MNDRQFRHNRPGRIRIDGTHCDRRQRTDVQLNTRLLVHCPCLIQAFDRDCFFIRIGRIFHFLYSVWRDDPRSAGADLPAVFLLSVARISTRQPVDNQCNYTDGWRTGRPMPLLRGRIADG